MKYTYSDILNQFTDYQQQVDLEMIRNYLYLYPSANDQLIAKKNPDRTKNYYHNDHLGSTSVITRQTGTLLEETMNYSYDSVGNVLGITNNLLTKTQTFGYDDLDRLKTASETGGFNYSYEYNAIGNITKFTNAGIDTDYVYGQNAGAHALTLQQKPLQR